MSGRVTVAGCISDAHYFVRQAELALKRACRQAPADLEGPLEKAVRHTAQLRKVLGRQVQRQEG